MAAATPDPDRRALVLVPLDEYGWLLASNRVALYVHTVAGALAGVLGMIHPPDPQSLVFATLRQLPGWPWSWSLWITAACITTIIGRAAGRTRVTAAGLLGMAAWALTMATGYLTAALLHGAAFWAVPIYVGLAAVYALHLALLTGRRQ